MRPAVVVLDDDEDMRHILRSTLREVDPGDRYLCHDTASLKEARGLLDRFAEEGRPALLFCDQRMPESDGVTFVGTLQGLRERTRIRVVLLSSAIDVNGDQDAKGVGVDRIVEKPFSMARWHKLVAELLHDWEVAATDAAPSQP